VPRKLFLSASVSRHLMAMHKGTEDLLCQPKRIKCSFVVSSKGIRSFGRKGGEAALPQQKETERVREIFDTSASQYDRGMAFNENLLFGDGRACSQVRGQIVIEDRI
jgi:hypothetical protein